MILFLHIPDFLQACSYRAPMMIREVMIFSHRFEKYAIKEQNCIVAQNQATRANTLSKDILAAPQL